MYFYIFMLLVAVLRCVNCDEYETVNILELLNNVDYKNDDDLIGNIIVITPQSDDSEKNSNIDVENENKYVKDFDKYETKPILREGVDMSRIETSNTGRVLKYQHKKKMEEIVDYLRDHYSSTNYFYTEMQRIQKQHSIKDKMREMIDYLEMPEHWRLKNKILGIFEKLKRKKIVEDTMWNDKTNDLVINVFKDPYNDGVVN